MNDRQPFTPTVRRISVNSVKTPKRFLICDGRGRVIDSIRSDRCNFPAFVAFVEVTMEREGVQEVFIAQQEDVDSEPATSVHPCVLERCPKHRMGFFEPGRQECDLAKEV